MICTENNDKERMARLMREHPDWNWMKWEQEWQRTHDEDYWAIAMSMMLGR